MDQSSVGRYSGAALPASYFMVGSSSFAKFLAATSVGAVADVVVEARKRKPGG